MNAFKRPLALLFSIFLAHFSFSQCVEPFISEYVEGASNDKAIEVYNPGMAPLDMTGYSLVRFTNGGVTPSSTFNFVHSIAGGGTYVLVKATADSVLKLSADTLHGICNWNGDDAIVLFNPLGDTLDILGVVGVDPGASWPVDTGSTADYTLQRRDSVHEGTTDWAIGATQYIAHPIGYWAGLGNHSMQACALPPGITAIGNINTVDIDGVADSMASMVTVQGIVYGPDLRLSMSGTAFTLIDASGGIGIYNGSTTFGYTVTEGDMIEISGTVGQFNGYQQVVADTIIQISSGNTLKSPTLITDLNEATESDLLRMDSVWLVDPLQWTGLGVGFNCDITNGTDTVQIRIDDDINLYSQPAPTDTFNVCGLGGQYDNTFPFLDGYQMFPRYSQDIKPLVLPSNPELNFSVLNQTINEGIPSFTVEVTILSPNASATSVDVVVMGGNALAGTDYTYTTTTVTFPAGSSAPQTVTVLLTDDALIEGNETIMLGFANPTNSSTIGAVDVQTITIEDNDLPTYPIAQVSGMNVSNELDSIGVNCILGGIVYGGNTRFSFTGTSFTIIDPTAGIVVFNSSNTLGYVVTEGDSVEIHGTITQFNGLSEIIADTIILHSSGNSLIAPDVVTSLSESTESDLVQLDNVWLVDPVQWTSAGFGFNVDVTNGMDTINVRIDDDVNLFSMPAPLDTFILCGLGNQYDNTSPYNSGYQLMPRYDLDIKPIVPPVNPVVSFSIPGQTISETGGSVTIEVTITSPNANATSVDIILGGGGTATVGSDYTFTSPTTVTFPPNSSVSQTIIIPINDDALIEGMEHIYLNLFNTTNGATISNGSHFVDIIDDDIATYSISQVTGMDADVVPDSIGVQCILGGVVYGVNIRASSTGTSFVIMDPTDGIVVFNGSSLLGYTVTEGDSIEVRGTIGHFNGLAEIIADTIILHSTGNAMKTPTVITALDEVTESDLLKFSSVWLVDPAQWTGIGSGFNVQVTNGIDTLEARIDNDVNLYGMPAPLDTFDLCGLGGQYDAIAPHDSGYQILPRYDLDIKPIVNGPGPEVFITSAGQTVIEGTTYAFVNVGIVNPDGNPTTVEMVLGVGGTATLSSDFTYNSPTIITFPGNSTMADTIVAFPIIDDTDVEGDETIMVEIVNATNGATIGNSMHTITIQDNDFATYSISQVTGMDGNNVADSVGVGCILRGVVYGVNMRFSTTGTEFTMIDPTDGIGVFSSSSDFGYTVTEGDSIEVHGTIGQYNGLTQIYADTIIHLTSANPLKTPAIVTGLDETTESDLIQFNNMWLVDPAQWTGAGGGFNVDVTNGVDTILMRIDYDVNLFNQAAPLDTFILCGIGGQYDSSSPYSAGYQIFPRYDLDLKPIITPTSPQVSFSASSSTSNEATGTVMVEVTLSNPDGNATSVDVVLQLTGTATNGSDYVFTSPTTITFPAGSTVADTIIEITIIDDLDLEGNETIVLTLQNPTNGATILVGTHTLTIEDNELPAVPTYTIGQIAGLTVDGEADSLGVQCILNGIVYGVDIRASSSGSQFTLRDQTGGISVFSFNATNYSVMEGDSISVQGTIDQYNGLLEIIPDSITYHTSGNPLKQATLISAYSESIESDLVRLDTVWLTDPLQWTGVGGGFNVDVTNGTDTFSVRIDNDVNLYSQPAPVDSFNLCGLGTQYDSSIPYDEGYQIMPRYGQDIKPLIPANAVSVSFQSSFSSVNEGGGVVMVSLIINNPDANATSVEVSLAGGTATDGADFTFGGPVMVTFPAGSSTADTIIEIEILEDLLQEGIETIELELMNPTNSAFIGQGSITIEIVDNDLPIYTIGQVTPMDVDGVADSVGITCILRGVVYGVNMRSSGVQFTLIDPTDGINVYNSSDDFGYIVMEGDSVEVFGEIDQFGGMTQINVAGITLLSSANPLKNPLVVTTLDEVSESDLVKLEGMSLVDPAQWTGAGSGFNVDVTNGVDTFALRIDSEVDLFSEPAPIGMFHICGIGGQYDTSAPHDDGYQLFPRYIQDIKYILFVDLGPDQSVCAGDSVTLNAGNPGSTYIWSTGDTSQIVTVAAGSEYSVTVAGTESDTIMINSLSVPTVDFDATTMDSMAYDFSDLSSDSPTSWFWEFGDGTNSSVQNPSHSYVNPGVYNVTLTASNDCGDGFSSQSVVVIAVGRWNDLSDLGIKVFPNPTSGKISLKSGNSYIQNIQVTNIQGKVVSGGYENLNSNSVREINLNEFPSGIYFIKMEIDGFTKSVKVLKK